MITTAIGAAYSMNRSETHLITPTNLGIFAFCLFPDRGIFFFQQAFHFLRFLLESMTHRFLWCKIPTHKISNCRPDRKLYTKSPFNQLCNRLPSPEVKQQLKLVRITINDSLGNICNLPGKKQTALWTALLFCLQRLCTVLTVCFYPLPNRLSLNAQQLCNFNLLPAIQYSFDRLTAKVFLGN